MQLEQLRNFCLSLPAVEEGIKWTDTLAFTIGSKMFCISSLQHPFKFSVKVQKEQFEELIQRESIIPAAYLARAHWITVQEPASLHNVETERLVLQSYELIKCGLTKKIRMVLGVS